MRKSMMTDVAKDLKDTDEGDSLGTRKRVSIHTFYIVREIIQYPLLTFMPYSYQIRSTWRSAQL